MYNSEIAELKEVSAHTIRYWHQTVRIETNTLAYYTVVAFIAKKS
jgi:hypothetical protein